MKQKQVIFIIMLMLISHIHQISSKVNSQMKSKKSLNSSRNKKSRSYSNKNFKTDLRSFLLKNQKLKNFLKTKTEERLDVSSDLWVHCANKNEDCHIPKGTYMVKYGDGKIWAYKEYNSSEMSIKCNDDTFKVDQFMTPKGFTKNKIRQVEAQNIVWGVNKDMDIFTREGPNGQWKQIPGKLKKVSVASDGRVWGVNAANEIFTRPGVEGDWQKIDGGLSDISVAKDGRVWGVNSANQIYTRLGVNGTWQMIDGGLSNIAVGDDGRIWGVNSNQDIWTRPGVTGAWQQIPGKLKNISVGKDGRVWGVNSADDIFTRPGVTGDWQQIPGKLSNISVGMDGIVWGINSGDDIFWRNGLSTDWKIVDGKLRTISTNSSASKSTQSSNLINIVWGVNKDMDIFTREGPNGQWKLIPGKLKKISVASDGRVWGVNASNEIFTRPGVDGDWQKIDGGLTDISVAKDGRVWGVNTANQIYTRLGVNGTWQMIDGGLSNIAVGDDGRVWGINSNQDIFTRPGVTGNWQQIPGKLKNISVGKDGRVWGVNSADDIFTRPGVTGDWQQIPGKLSNISVGMDGIVWGINSGDDIFWRNGLSTDWKLVDGKLRTISTNSYNKNETTVQITPQVSVNQPLPPVNKDTNLNELVWGTNSNNDIFFRNGINGEWKQIDGKVVNLSVGTDGRVWAIGLNQDIYTRKDEKDPWQRIEGGLINISVGQGGRVWGVNAANDIFTRPGVLGEWKQIPGKLKNISVGEDGRVWGINGANEIFTRPGVEGEWQKIDGGLSNISVGKDGRVWGVNSSNQIYTRLGVNGNWQGIPGGLSNISVGQDGRVWGVNSAGAIFTRPGVDGDWLNIPGSLKTISYNTKLKDTIDPFVRYCRIKNTPYNWKNCGSEGQNCNISNTSIIKYGADSRWVYRTMNSSFNCSNTIFGDPAYGVGKNCFVLEDSFWKNCANEHETCRFTGTELVRYGNDNKYNYQMIQESTLCGNNIFGDPAPGLQKACDVHMGPIIWIPCAKENEKCKFNGESIVRYGAEQKFSFRRSTDSIDCNNAVFGDPISGAQKRCDYAVYNADDLPQELLSLEEQEVAEPEDIDEAVLFSTCEDTNGFGFPGKCLKSFASKDTQDAPMNTKEKVRFIFDTLKSIALPFDGCIGDFSGNDIANPRAVSVNICNALPLMTEFNYGILGGYVRNVPCGTTPVEIAFCLAYDRCGTVAVTANAGIVQCAATYSTGIAAIFSAFSDVLDYLSFGISVKRRFTYSMEIPYRNGASVEIKEVTTFGHFFLQLGLALPLSDLSIGSFKISDFFSLNITALFMIDFGNLFSTIGGLITDISNANKNTGKELVKKILKTNSEMTVSISGELTLNLSYITRGFLPDIGINIAQSNLLVSLGNEGASGMIRGIYFYNKRGINNISAVVNLLLTPIKSLISIFGVTIPDFDFNLDLSIGFGIFINSDSLGVTLVFPGISLYCLCIHNNSSCSCGVNGSFFTALLEAGKWLVKQARQIAETVGKIAVEVANEVGKFAVNAAKATENFFKNDVRNFFERDVKNALNSAVNDVGNFIVNDVGKFIVNDVGNFITKDVGNFITKDVGNFITKDVGNFITKDVGGVVNDVGNAIASVFSGW